MILLLFQFFFYVGLSGEAAPNRESLIGKSAPDLNLTYVFPEEKQGTNITLYPVLNAEAETYKGNGEFAVIGLDPTYQQAVDGYNSHKQNLTNFQYYLWIYHAYHYTPYFAYLSTKEEDHFKIPHPVVVARNESRTVLMNEYDPNTDPWSVTDFIAIANKTLP